MRRMILLAASAATVFAMARTPAAQEKIDSEMIWKIRREAAERSEILETLHVLTDVYGPRLTGSANTKAAAEWVVKRAGEWGLQNAHLEPWDFGHPGWANERTSAFLVAPVKDSLVVETLAWTPGTTGAVTASVVQIDAPGRVTEERLAAYFEANRARVKGRIVMVGAPARVPVTINKTPLRREDADLRAQYDPENPAPAARGGRGPGGPPPDRNVLPANQVNERVDQFLVSAGAVARLTDAGRDHGQIRAFHNRTFDWPRRCRHWWCGTKITAASHGCSAGAPTCSSSSRSSIASTSKGVRRIT